MCFWGAIHEAIKPNVVARRWFIAEAISRILVLLVFDFLPQIKQVLPSHTPYSSHTQRMRWEKLSRSFPRFLKRVEGMPANPSRNFDLPDIYPL